MSRTSRGCVTLCCRLLVIVRYLRLVVLVFEECLELRGGVLLFDVGCWLLCDRYVWSYWFSTLLVVHAFCTARDCGFLTVNWAVLCFVDVLHLGLYEIKLQKPGGPVRQGNLAVYCLFSTALTWEQVWHPWAVDGGSGAIKPVLWPYVRWYHVALHYSRWCMACWLAVAVDFDLMTTCSICHEEYNDNLSCPVCAYFFRENGGGMCMSMPLGFSWP